MGKPDPADIEDAKAASRVVASMAYDHYTHLIDSGFSEDSAFTLAENYHWRLLAMGYDDDD